jgi:hypothetical protein
MGGWFQARRLPGRYLDCMPIADDSSPSKSGPAPHRDLAGRIAAASRVRDFAPSDEVDTREVVRDGQITRIYRQSAQKWAMCLGGLVIFVPLTVRVVTLIAGNSYGAGHSSLLIVVPLALYAAIPTGWFFWTRRLGVYVSDAGVRNVSVSRVNFTKWPAIDRFVVAQYAPLSSCVFAEHGDGSRTALNALSRWTKWQTALTPYCDALNHELAIRRPTA